MAFAKKNELTSVVTINADEMRQISIDINIALGQLNEAILELNESTKKAKKVLSDLKIENAVAESRAVRNAQNARNARR